ncbi:MAG: CRISPR-associated endonuclease Cas2 [Coriobacteriales bacterium]|jgi:CRISPR-associated protein Cas2|nr:CRISPR-associated endonuclease Cas2 [Coriobacteriales bacterium]
MRTLVMFDLPTLTSAEQKQYRIFRKKLIKEGFVMMQYSIYCKLTLNSTQKDRIERFVESNKPAAGNVAMLTITEKQFANIKYVLGQFASDVLTTTDRLVVI